MEREGKQENARPIRFESARPSPIQQRKNEHIDICLQEDVKGLASGAGFDQYRFIHHALPELSFQEIDTSTRFLGREMKVPLLISSMTGGTPEAGEINRRLAGAAQRRGWAMGLGSGRAALESEEVAATFRVREIAPDIPLLANLGAVQLRLGYGTDDCKRLIDLTGADGLVLHLNGMQEIFQPEGDTDFKGLFSKISDLCRQLDAPVGVKEVGWGIDADMVRRLIEAGVAFVDVAGAGGTSWSEVEKHRLQDEVKRKAVDAFKDWGIPTAVCIREARAAKPDAYLIGSGGVRHGVDGAKALALGADLAGFGRTLLGSATESEERIEAGLAQIEFELRAAMFGIGAGDLTALQQTNRLVSRSRYEV